MRGQWRPLIWIDGRASVLVKRRAHDIIFDLVLETVYVDVDRIARLPKAPELTWNVRDKWEDDTPRLLWWGGSSTTDQAVH